MNTRFAPSLTGYLHLGHVLHMLYVWGIAKDNGAKVICRIEDHDLGRTRPEYEPAILETMAWLGFIPDLGLSAIDSGVSSDYRQSDCGAHYVEVLKTLEERGLVYGCECSRKQILETQPDGLSELCYSGTCSEKNLPLKGNTVRFRIQPESVTFTDLALGPCHQTPTEQSGDFSLRDRNGQWTYQFCCVCDDIRQGVDLVVRGEDILSSTARQIQLYQALEQPAPHYFHHSLLYDESGEKLSKRQRSESITTLREAGESPEQIIGRAVFYAGLASSANPILKNDAIDKYII